MERKAEDKRRKVKTGPGKGFSAWIALRLTIIAIVCALLIESAFNALLPLGLRFFIDRVLPSGNRDALWLLVEVLAGGAAIAVFTGFICDFLSARVQTRYLSGLRQSMFERAQHVSFDGSSADVPSAALTSESRAAGLLERFSADFASIERAAGSSVSWGALPAVEALVCTGLMLWLDWRAGLVGFLLWPWTCLAPRTFSARVARAGDACRQYETGVLGAFEEHLSAHSVIRAYSLEQMGVAAFQKRNDILSRGMRRSGLLSAFMERFNGGGILGIQTFLLLLSALLAFESRMSVGTLAALQALAFLLSNSLLLLNEYMPSVPEARQAWRRIVDALGSPPAVQDKPDARILPPLQEEIIFANVDFSYDGRGKELAGIQLRIPRGTSVAFVGPSGSGKSTLLKLLMRYYDPTEGFIAIDGHDLRSVTLASLRSQIGVVLQENAVFSATVRENIRLARPKISEEAIVNAAIAARLHDSIMALPHGYGTLLGENGVRLAPADVQRLAIARAILRDPEILLLDQATSLLDPADELAVAETLRSISPGRTVISITRRLSTVIEADQIFVFNRGEIVEQGRHFELVAADGLYAGLLRKQAGFRFSADGRHVDVDPQRLRAIPILENVEDRKLAELAPFFATETIQPGREIVHQNDPGDKFYILVRGKAEAWRAEDSAALAEFVGTLQDGDFFGEVALISGFPRPFTVRAVTVCTCISLERGQFNRMTDRYPELRRQMSEIAMRRLRGFDKSAAAAGGVSVA